MNGGIKPHIVFFFSSLVVKSEQIDNKEIRAVHNNNSILQCTLEKPPALPSPKNQIFAGCGVRPSAAANTAIAPVQFHWKLLFCLGGDLNHCGFEFQQYRLFSYTNI